MLLGVPGQVIGRHGDRQGGLAGLGGQGGVQSLVGQEGRVDPPGQVPEVLQGLRGLGLGLGQEV